MRKYEEIARVYLKTQMAWRADVIVQMLFTVTRIVFAYLLWGMIFAEKREVAGFSFQGMLSYYIVSSFLTQLDMSNGISEEISSRIRQGSFSNFMVMPVNMENYFVAQEIGVVAFYLGFDLIAAFVWIFIFQIEFVLTQSIWVMLCALFMAAFGLFFMVQLNFYLGILTLKYEEISTFLLIKSNLVALVTGSIVPLALFPEKIVQGMKILPFYYVTYLPSMLMVGRCQEEAATGLVVIGLWCVLMQVVIKASWRTYRKKYDGVGI